MITEKQRKMEILLGLTSRTQRSMAPPMKYPGSKYNSLPEILPELPYTSMYVEVFGGAATVLLNRAPVNFEVYNDRFSGIVAFFRAVRDYPFELIARVELMLHSREEWERCRATWHQPNIGVVERAARWYYMTRYSVLGRGDSWARIRKPGLPIASSMKKRLDLLQRIADRFEKVQIENLDWREILNDYDHPQAVFYLDPPYLNSNRAGYKQSMTVKDHKEMIKQISEMKAYVVLSGYENDIYNVDFWDRKKTWARKDNASVILGEGMGTQYEVLWIKEAR